MVRITYLTSSFPVGSHYGEMAAAIPVAVARSPSKFDDYSDDAVDPRVKEELEKLNEATDAINKLEVELDEARAVFRQVLTESTQRLNILAKKLGSCIEKGRPYYDARLKARQAQVETQKAAVKFERANSMHRAAVEMVNLAEQGLVRHGGNFDPTWQEMLNHATLKVNQAEVDKISSASEHRCKSHAYNDAEQNVKELQRELKRSIAKSRPYFEMKASFNKLLEEQRNRVRAVEANVAVVKQQYAGALHSLEDISEAIHERRKRRDDVAALGERSAGVGSETPPPAPSVEAAAATVAPSVAAETTPGSSPEDVFVADGDDKDAGSAPRSREVTSADSTPGLPAGSGFVPGSPAGSGFVPGSPAGSGFAPGLPAGSGFVPGSPVGSGFAPGLPAAATERGSGWASTPKSGDRSHTRSESHSPTPADASSGSPLRQASASAVLESSTSSCDLSGVSERSRRRSTVTFDIRTDLRNIRQELADLEEELYPTRGRRRAVSVFWEPSERVPPAAGQRLLRRRDTMTSPEEVARERSREDAAAVAAGYASPSGLSLNAQLLEACAISEAACAGVAETTSDFMKLPRFVGRQSLSAEKLKGSKAHGLLLRLASDPGQPAAFTTDHARLPPARVSVVAATSDRPSCDGRRPRDASTTAAGDRHEKTLTCSAPREATSAVDASKGRRSTSAPPGEESEHVQLSDRVTSDCASVASCDVLDDHQVEH
ncbi:PREDICTED: SH3 domain-binding protein 5-like isoform X2 [Priapulus caudatus]|uniref:SH3 domain-binding protein 5-like isoform X2 n=1 Tax=Priapulus caudatus TaxID=37621 RepID=A0ABM1ERT5_PRICU|nr:PREDICTED: SH3 domain-binding protein 5-like isoform X2 [Priapulus caudatus]